MCRETAAPAIALGIDVRSNILAILAHCADQPGERWRMRRQSSSEVNEAQLLTATFSKAVKRMPGMLVQSRYEIRIDGG